MSSQSQVGQRAKFINHPRGAAKRKSVTLARRHLPGSMLEPGRANRVLGMWASTPFHPSMLAKLRVDGSLRRVLTYTVDELIGRSLAASPKEDLWLTRKPEPMHSR